MNYYLILDESQTLLAIETIKRFSKKVKAPQEARQGLFLAIEMIERAMMNQKKGMQ